MSSGSEIGGGLPQSKTLRENRQVLDGVSCNRRLQNG